MSEQTAKEMSRPAGFKVLNHHWVSPHNFDPKVQEAYHFPAPLTIYDSTIRKILLTAGLRPKMSDLMDIVAALDDVGVRHMNFNVLWLGDDAPPNSDYAICRAVLDGGFGFKTSVHTDVLVRNPFLGAISDKVNPHDVLESFRGADTVAVIASDPIEAEGRETLLEGLTSSIAMVRAAGFGCAVTVADVGRMDFGFLIRLCKHCAEVGATCIDLSDSYGSMAPQAMSVFIRRVRTELNPQVELTLHVHDDFGLASAAALAAASAGAHPDVSVNGMSYRAGFAALEEVATCLELLYGISTGIALEKLTALSRLVEEKSGMPMHPLKPITGRHAFLRDAPQWMIPYLKKGANAFPPTGSCVVPAVVGGEMSIVWSTHPSNGVINAKLEQMGIRPEKTLVTDIRKELEDRVAKKVKYPIWLTETEFETVCLKAARRVGVPKAQ